MTLSRDSSARICILYARVYAGISSLRLPSGLLHTHSPRSLIFIAASVSFALLFQPFDFLLHHFLRAEIQRGEAPVQRLFQLRNRRCLVARFQIIAR